MNTKCILLFLAGSGIFSGKAGALISLMTGVPTTKLLVAKVPKVPGQVNTNITFITISLVTRVKNTLVKDCGI